MRPRTVLVLATIPFLFHEDTRIIATALILTIQVSALFYQKKESK